MPLFDVINANIQLFFERKARISKNNVSLQLLVPISAIYSQIHIYLYTWQQLTTRRLSSQWWAYLRLSHKPETDSEEHLPIVLLRSKIGIIGLNGAGKSTLMKSSQDLSNLPRVRWFGAQATLWATCLRILRSTRTRP